MKQRLDRDAPPEEAANLWSAAFILMGLRYEQAVIQSLLRRVVAMKESVTYQAILEAGRAEGEARGEARGEAKGRAEGEAKGKTAEARRMLLLLGREQFGEPSAQVQAILDGLTDVALLERLTLQLKHATSWQELLGKPSSRRRSPRRKPSA
jgi:predicted transposase YdaD